MAKPRPAKVIIEAESKVRKERAVVVEKEIEKAANTSEKMQYRAFSYFHVGLLIFHL